MSAPFAIGFCVGFAVTAAVWAKVLFSRKGKPDPKRTTERQ